MKHIHFIGICGVGMSSLAILWKKKGWKVTGSDVGFYPPISTHLKNHQVEYYPGWHPEHIGSSVDTVIPDRDPESSRLDSRLRGNDNVPDLVVVGNVAGSENPEWKFVQENKIPYLSYPELIAQNLVKKNSIVCAGTYGKTSSTVLLSWILTQANWRPAYMFGGLSLNLSESADDPTNTEWSVLEGDEYKTSRWDNRAKFFSYQPTHLLLTDIIWDHADVYPTEAEYFSAFEKLVEMIPNHGLIVASENIPDYILKKAQLAPARIIRYGKNSGEYIYQNIQQDKDGLRFDIVHDGKTFPIHSPIIGEYMADNICGCFALASAIGIEPELIISALAKFHGIKRRLEKRGTLNKADILDDIAHSPIKAKSTLETLRKTYPGKIFAIFEPNTGNREMAAIPQYDNAFADADTIIIPRLTKIKIKPGEKTIAGDELAKIISRTHKNVKYFEEDEKLIDFVRQNVGAGDVVVFLGSHGFRGMIKELMI